MTTTVAAICDWISMLHINSFWNKVIFVSTTTLTLGNTFFVFDTPLYLSLYCVIIFHQNQLDWIFAALFSRVANQIKLECCPNFFGAWVCFYIKCRNEMTRMSAWLPIFSAWLAECVRHSHKHWYAFTFPKWTKSYHLPPTQITTRMVTVPLHISMTHFNRERVLICVKEGESEQSRSNMFSAHMLHQNQWNVIMQVCLFHYDSMFVGFYPLRVRVSVCVWVCSL